MTDIYQKNLQPSIYASWPRALVIALVLVLLVVSTAYAIWTPIIVDSLDNAGQFASLKIVNGNPAIAYHEANNDDLKFVRAADVTGTSWGAPVTVDAVNDGFYTDLAVVNGNPAISHFDGSSGALLYVRALDANGSSWAVPVTVDSTSSSGFYNSLTVVNGNPAISYFEGGTGTNHLKFVRATNADGTSWGTPIIIDDSSALVGWYTSLSIVNGNPAVSYYDASNGDLKFIRANNTNGTSWGVPINVDSVGNVGRFTSLALIKGNPAISYYDLTNGDLKYVRANNENGSSWGTPITVDSNDNVGQHTSLMEVNEAPAISYYDLTNSQLKYTRASDAIGLNWNNPSPSVVDALGTVGENTSLLVVNGNPAIAYYDAGNGDLKYAHSSNPTYVQLNTISAYPSLAIFAKRWLFVLLMLLSFTGVIVGRYKTDVVGKHNRQNHNDSE